MQPLVSCIMPTRGRGVWAAQALEMFLSQTYEDKELIIVDDASDPSFPDGVNIPELVTYCRAGQISIGAKRNIAVEVSSGEIIAHWDSDDLYSCDRLAHQAEMLTRPLELVGYHQMLFWDVERGTVRDFHASPCHPIGVSLMYWRTTWEARRFEDVNVGEDNNFANGRSMACVPADGRIIARVHGGNTSEKRGPMAQNPAQWRLIA